MINMKLITLLNYFKKFNKENKMKIPHEKWLNYCLKE